MTKKTLFIDKIIYLKNLFFVVCLLLLYLIPFLPYDVLPYLSILGLFYPLLLGINALFVVYWIVKLKKKMILSLVVIFLGYSHISELISFNIFKPNHSQQSIKVMTYNVRLFNRYNLLKDKHGIQKINHFINNQKLDILCIQEFYAKNFKENTFKFKYTHQSLTGNKRDFGLAIYTVYPIINKGIIKFENSYNQVIYADMLMRKDTVRVYNFHLESLKINPNDYTVEKGNPKKIKSVFHIINNGFSKHKIQANKLRKHIDQSPYKNIVCGDMNNTPLSYEYRIIKGDMVDSFSASSFGITSTFAYWYPLRIDFIFADKTFRILEHIVPKKNLSDHYPVIMTFQ